MNEINFFQQTYWNIFSHANINSAWLYLNASTLINSWLVLGIILLISIGLRYLLTCKNNPLAFCALNGIASFMDLTTETLGSFNYTHFSFIFSLFMFIVLCNWLSLLPLTTEPTKDINTTLALGIIAFLYKDIFSIKVNGIKGYLAEFTEPFFVMAPVNLIGHFSKIISLSFRLFGNIFGGAIIMELYLGLLNYSFIAEILGLMGPNYIMIIAFVVFEGLIQAFVFSMLSLTYLAIAIQHPEGEE